MKGNKLQSICMNCRYTYANPKFHSTSYFKFCFNMNYVPALRGPCPSHSDFQSETGCKVCA